MILIDYLSKENSGLKNLRISKFPLMIRNCVFEDLELVKCVFGRRVLFQTSKTGSVMFVILPRIFALHCSCNKNCFRQFRVVALMCEKLRKIRDHP